MCQKANKKIVLQSLKVKNKKSNTMKIKKKSKKVFTSIVIVIATNLHTMMSMMNFGNRKKKNEYQSKNKIQKNNDPLNIVNHL